MIKSTLLLSELVYLWFLSLDCTTTPSFYLLLISRMSYLSLFSSKPFILAAAFFLAVQFLAVHFLAAQFLAVHF